MTDRKPLIAGNWKLNKTIADAIELTLAALKSQLERFLDFSPGPTQPKMLNNRDWLGKMSMIDYLHNCCRFFAHESCGQCTPCREGTTWLERIFDRILSGRGRRADIDLLLDVCDGISPGLTWPPIMTTICPLGPSATALLVSLMQFFRHEVEAMIDEEVTVA